MSGARLFRRPARVGLDARRFGIREKQFSHPEREASASFRARISVLAKHTFRRKTVRSCAPSNIAMSSSPTPSANSNGASARFAMRASVYAGRIAASICSPRPVVIGTGWALGPGCARVTRGSPSILHIRYTNAKTRADSP